MNLKYIIAVIAIIVIICGCAFALTNSQNSGSVKIDSNALQDKESLIVDAKSLDENNGLYHTAKSDVNSILIKNAGKLKLTNSIINKTGDTQTSGDDADFYGVNSAILVNTNGTLDISDVEINTNSKGSNGIFVTNGQTTTNTSQSNSNQQSGGQPPEAQGTNDNPSAGGQPPEAQGTNDNPSAGGQPPEAQGGAGGQAPDAQGGSNPGESTVEGNTKADIKNVKITTHSDKSRGLDATYNGIINAENVIINTDGQSCAALATDRGEGEVHVKNSDINTGVSKSSGRGSPLIYSTGNITAENTKGTSHVSQIACIEGKNSIELTDCDLVGYGEGNRKDGDTYVDLGGIFIYQSMSGDANVGTSLFTAKNSKLAIAEDSSVYKQAPMFHVTNTACIINLENTEFSFGSGTFIEVSGQNQWGSEGSNGGDAQLNLNNEKIDGNVIVDSISSLALNMTKTEFKGAINSSGNTTVNVGEGSTWTLTGDSSVSGLEVSGNIDYGDYNLVVNNKTYNSKNPYKA
ncbi:MAG: hypothetical protein E7Z76_04680 [Methanobrevibacter sp.]|nr:hypothetical protein [Methanobrevibacter sp.]